MLMSGPIKEFFLITASNFSKSNISHRYKLKWLKKILQAGSQKLLIYPNLIPLLSKFTILLKFTIPTLKLFLSSVLYYLCF